MEWGVIRSDQAGNPDQALTRADFMAITNRAYGYSVPGPTPFTDVEEDDWFWAVMRWNEKAHGWYNAECGTEPTYDGAASVAKDRFDKMIEKMGR